MMLISLFPALASASQPRYCSPVTANSVIGCASPCKQKAHKRHRTIAGAFFMSAVSFYGGCVREGFGPAGSLLLRSCTPARSYRPSCASDVGSSSAKGAIPMTTLSLPITAQINRARSAAHKAMAYAALRSNSSLNVRLARYNNHMNKARAIAGGAL